MEPVSTPSYMLNRDLFVNYYLTEHLPETEAWNAVDEDELIDAREEIRELWEEEKSTAPKRNESQLEEKFIRPLFRKLGIPFEVEEAVKHDQRRPDYAFFRTEDAGNDAFERREEGGDFYANAIAVADAKRWGRPLDTSGEKREDYANPSFQIDQYLRKTETTWGVLTTGEKWRLYYKPTSHQIDSFYEIDLPEILENGDLEDFKYFYLFFRHEAFLPDASGDTFLDDVQNESNLFARGLGDDLQENIYEAIKLLAEGFRHHPHNDITEEDLDLVHDSSLIYLYRLIFILYAEAEGRELLDTDNSFYQRKFSLNQLKQDVAEAIDNNDEERYPVWDDKLWHRINELFDLINQGSKAQGIPEDDLEIPAYNGELFRTNPTESDSPEARFLAETPLSDAHLAEVIDLLTRRKESGQKVFVDYSSLNIRHLGSIYEGLLEYQLNITDQRLSLEDGEYQPAEEDDEVAVETGDIYLTTDSGERKATGSYYTPEYVVQYIVDNTLGPLVEEIRQDLVGTDTYSEAGFAAEFAERVFELKILDPAMGSGHFLTNAVNYLAREIIDAQTRQIEQEGPETVDEKRDIYWARRQVAQRCIYGVDLNPLATELAKVSLWLRTLAAKQPLAFLDHHLKTGNSLVGSNIEDVLGNGSNDETEGGQLTLQESFEHTRQKALEHVTERFQDLLDIENETIEDIKDMEALFNEVQEDPLYQHLLAMANSHTADRFGLDVPDDAYERMAAALRDDSWAEIERQDWFRTAQLLAETEWFFHWELEFPVAFYGEDGEVQEDAGFDAVIGNPPYVKIQNLRATSPQLAEYLDEQYMTSTGRFDIYAAFVERGSQLACQQCLTYILPNKFFESSAGEGLRKFLSENGAIKQILDFGHQQVFSGATTYTCILSLGSSETFEYGQVRQSKSSTQELSNVSFSKIDIDDLDESPWVLTAPEERAVIQTIEEQGARLGDRCELISEGIVSGDNKILFVEILEMSHELTRVRTQVDGKELEFESELVHPLAMGDEINRFTTPSVGMGVIYPYRETKHGTEPIPEDILESDFPRTYSYLDDHRDRLADRGSESMNYPTWYALWCPRQKSLFESKKLLTPDICQHPKFTVDSQGDAYFADTVYGLVPKQNSEVERYALLSILNSSLSWFYIYFTSPVLRGDFRRFKTTYMEQIPVIATDDSSRKNPEYDVTEEISKDLTEDEPVTALAALGERQTDLTDRRTTLNLSLLDHLGNYTDGSNLPDIGIFQPTSTDILDSTSEAHEKLNLGEARTERDGSSVTIYATARHKPEDEDEHETDRWGYTETEYLEAFTLADLSETEADLVEAFVPVAVEEGDGFAGFRNNATKTTSLLDRLKSITLPDAADVEADLRRYVDTKERAEELDEKIEETDQLIDDIVYELYGLSDEEIAIVEEVVGD